MPDYDFTNEHGRVETHHVPVKDYDEYKKWMARLGWTRVLCPPASVYVFPSMEEIHKESIEEHRKLYGD